MRILAIDPGPVYSAYVLYDTDESRVIDWAKVENGRILTWFDHGAGLRVDELVIEMIASYGMPVGKDVFETCVWIGKFEEAWRLSHLRSEVSHRRRVPPTRRITRMQVKSHLCHSGKAADKNVRRALIDRFGGSDRSAIGLKATPGPLYGLSGDGWAALGVAVTAADNPTMNYR